MVLMVLDGTGWYWMVLDGIGWSWMALDGARNPPKPSVCCRGCLGRPCSPPKSDDPPGSFFGCIKTLKNCKNLKNLWKTAKASKNHLVIIGTCILDSWTPHLYSILIYIPSSPQPTADFNAPESFCMHRRSTSCILGSNPHPTLVPTTDHFLL